MNQTSLLSQFLTVFVDLITSAVLGLYALLIGPLGILRGPIALERTIIYLRTLLPLGLLGSTVRVAIDWRLGSFERAMEQLQGIVASLEDAAQRKKGDRYSRRVLEDFYTLLARCFLHTGRIDETMQVVIRAKKRFNIDRLGGLPDLDAKTAHLVRAGLAAGKLLDGVGLATLYVKTQQPSDPPVQETVLHGHDDIGGAKIIPFPQPDRRRT